MADIESAEDFARRIWAECCYVYPEHSWIDAEEAGPIVEARDAAIRSAALLDAYNAIVEARDEARRYSRSAEEGLDDASALVFGMMEKQ